MGLNPYEMRELFDQTVVVRKPRFGIVSGYHELPYVCLGESIESGYTTTRVKGRVQVSPRLCHAEPRPRGLPSAGTAVVESCRRSCSSSLLPSSSHIFAISRRGCGQDPRRTDFE